MEKTRFYRENHSRWIYKSWLERPDAKFPDFGNTKNGYVRYAFDALHNDVFMVNPYLGAEALKPFLDRVDKSIIVLCRTSNPGAGEFQDLKVVDGVPLDRSVARRETRKLNDQILACLNL